MARWRALAQRIPDASLRADALRAIDRKRGNIEGAVLFATLPSRRSDALLRLLVAYEIMADYLDCTTERAAACGTANGVQLHLALVDAVDPDAAPRDYYVHHPWRHDGGYLAALVSACGRHCAQLPSFRVVRRALHAVASLTEVLTYNHVLDARARDEALARWVQARFAGGEQLAWWEWSGGASAWLTVLALMAVAADAHALDEDVQSVVRAYLPWVSLVGTMLDSYSDQAEDRRNGDHSYIGHYQSDEEAVCRVRELIRRARSELAALKHGARHEVLIASMIAMYLSKDSARGPLRRDTTRSLAQAGGPLAQLLMPVLRVWRTVYRQASA